MRRFGFLLGSTAILLLAWLQLRTPAQAPVQAYAIPVREIGKQFILIGELGRPLCEEVRVVGTVVDDDGKGGRGILVRVEQVNGGPVASSVDVILRPYQGTFDLQRPDAAFPNPIPPSVTPAQGPAAPVPLGVRSFAKDVDYDTMPLLRENQRYEFVGYEAAAYKGMSAAARKRVRGPMQIVSQDLYFENYFTVLELRELPAR